MNLVLHTKCTPNRGYIHIYMIQDNQVCVVLNTLHILLGHYY